MPGSGEPLEILIGSLTLSVGLGMKNLMTDS